MTGIGLIGFGRVGRGLLRELQGRQGGLQVRAVAEVNPGRRPPEELAANLAYLLAHDTTHGPFAGRASARGSSLVVDEREIPVLLDRELAEVDWRALGVRVLVEASGDSLSAARAAELAGGAVDKVVITRSAAPAQVTLVRGVNLDDYDPQKHHVISCSTCTANALAPVLSVLDAAFGVERASLVSVHPALSGDTVLDAPNPVFVAGRSGLSLRPVTSEMARTTAQLLPQLKGRLMAMSLRIPTMVVNALLADLLLARPPREVDQAEAALARAAEAELAGVMDLERGFLGASRAAADFCGNPHSAVVDLNWLSLSGPMLRLLIWHDNEYAYCRRVADTLEVVARRPA